MAHYKLLGRTLLMKMQVYTICDQIVSVWKCKASLQA